MTSTIDLGWGCADVADDGYDGVQYDTEYAPSPGQLEAEAIRRECYGLEATS